MSSFTENFNGTDSQTVGVQQTWTDKAGNFTNASNAARVGTTDAINSSRCEQVLSTANHKAKLTITSLPTAGASTNAQLGPAVRYHSSDDTYYTARLIRGTNDEVYFFKCVAGTETQMGAAVGVTVSLPDDLELEVATSGSDALLTARWNGSQIAQRTDSTSPITGNVRCGITGYHNSGSGGSVDGDDFSAEDVGTTLTPGTLALTITTFAPTVTISGSQVVTPGSLALTITLFSPTVTVSTPGGPFPFDRVKETTTTTGTGTITLAGAASGFQAFSDVLDIGDRTVVVIESGVNWEVATATLGAGGTLSRDVILDSSNAGAAISLAGTSTVRLDMPADWLKCLPVSATIFGAKGDAIRVTDGAITASDATFTSASSTFTAADVGKKVAIFGAGAAGVVLTSTIASINSSTSVELAANAGTTVSGAVACYGTDNATPFQNAINAASPTGGIIEAPAGNYLVGGQVIVKSGVTFRGVNPPLRENNGLRGHSSDANSTANVPGADGTWLYIIHGPATAPTRHYDNSNATIRVYQNGCLSGFGIYYPLQVTNTASAGTAPPDYPYAIEMHERGVTVESIELLNAAYGIDARYTHVSLIRNVTGQPLKVGIDVAYVHDILRLENIHFNPWFAFDNNLYAWQQANGIAFRFALCEFLNAVNCFCYGYWKGFNFISSSANSESPLGSISGSCVGALANCGADGCKFPLDAESIAADNGVSFTGFKGTVTVNSGKFIATASTLGGALTIGNSHFWAASVSGAVIGTHAGGTLIITGCQFDDLSGLTSSGGTLIVMGNRFIPNATAVTADTGTSKAVVVGNVSAAGSGGFVNNIAGSGSFGNNI